MLNSILFSLGQIHKKMCYAIKCVTPCYIMINGLHDTSVPQTVKVHTLFLNTGPIVDKMANGHN